MESKKKSCNTYPANVLFWKCRLLCTSDTSIQMHLIFIMETNTVNPDQTAPEQSDLGSYCLQYMLRKTLED